MLADRCSLHGGHWHIERIGTAAITNEQVFSIHHDDNSLIIVIEYADVCSSRPNLIVHLHDLVLAGSATGEFRRKHNARIIHVGNFSRV